MKALLLFPALLFSATLFAQSGAPHPPLPGSGWGWNTTPTPDDLAWAAKSQCPTLDGCVAVAVACLRDPKNLTESAWHPPDACRPSAMKAQLLAAPQDRMKYGEGFTGLYRTHLWQ